MLLSPAKDNLMVTTPTAKMFHAKLTVIVGDVLILL